MTKRKRRGGRVTESPRSQARSATSSTASPTTRGGAGAAQLTMPRPTTASDGGARSALLGLRRSVPADIGRPPYAATGQPPPGRGRSIQPPEIIERMRLSGGHGRRGPARGRRGGAAGHHHRRDRRHRPRGHDRRGTPTRARSTTRTSPSRCAPRSTRSSATASPTARPLLDGDIVNIDVTIYLDGVHGDTNATFLVGDVDEDIAHGSCVRPATAMCAGHRGGHAGRPRLRHRSGHRGARHRLRARRGARVHRPRHRRAVPQRPADPALLRRAGRHRARAGHDLHHRADDHARLARRCTCGTTAGRRSPATAVARAQFEHTMVVTDDGVELLTVTADGRCAADQAADL